MGAGAGVVVVVPPVAGVSVLISVFRPNANHRIAITTMTTITPTTHFPVLDIPSLHGSGGLVAQQ
jgi:hypothetical protein